MKDNSMNIAKRYANMCKCAADRDEVYQLAAIAKWQAQTTHDPSYGPVERFINSKVSHGIRNGMRDWLQTRKTDKPATMSYYSTISDRVEP